MRAWYFGLSLAILSGLLSLSVQANLNDKIEKQCKGSSNPTACTQTVELAWIKQHKKLIKRVGDTLELTLENGKVLLFKDIRNDPEKNVTYQFYDYLSDIDNFLIEEHYDEGSGYSLVDRRSGAISKIDDLPVFSPDRNRFITISICDAFCPYRLQIWQRHKGKGGFELVWSHKPHDYWVSGKAQWLDGNTIKLTKRIRENPNSGYSDYVDRNFYIRLVADAWSISDTIKSNDDLLKDPKKGKK